MSVIDELNPSIWVMSVPVVGFVILQSVIFLVRALRFNKKHNLLSKQEVKECVKAGIISTIGPATNTAFMAVTLVLMIGAGLTFIRLGVIGSGIVELFNASIASQSLGEDLGPHLDYAAYIFVMMVLNFGSFGFIFFGATIPKYMDKLSLQSKGKSTQKGKGKLGEVVTYLSAGFGVSVVTFSGLNFMGNSLAKCVTYFACMAISMLLVMVARKDAKYKWLFSMNITISLILGMALGQVLISVFGIS